MTGRRNLIELVRSRNISDRKNAEFKEIHEYYS